MVAEHFGKRHDHILRDLSELQKDVPNFGEMFIETTYPDAYGRLQKAYALTRDGFSLLVMGFTGKAALEWKLKYIEAFNRMEMAIRESVHVIAAPDLKAKRLEIMERNSITRRAQMAAKLLDHAGDRISPSERAAAAVEALNELMGRRVALPPVTDKRYTTTELAEELGVTVQALGRKVQHLKTPENGEDRMSKSRHSDKVVNQWYWTEAGRKAVKEAMA